VSVFLYIFTKKESWHPFNHSSIFCGSLSITSTSPRVSPCIIDRLLDSMITTKFQSAQTIFQHLRLQVSAALKNMFANILRTFNLPIAFSDFSYHNCHQCPPPAYLSLSLSLSLSLLFLLCRSQNLLLVFLVQLSKHLHHLSMSGCSSFEDDSLRCKYITNIILDRFW